MLLPAAPAQRSARALAGSAALAMSARHYGTGPRLYPGHGHWLLQEPGWEAIADDALAWLSASLR